MRAKEMNFFLQRLVHVRLKKLYIKDLTGMAQEVFINKDKNPKMVRTEIACKKATINAKVSEWREEGKAEIVEKKRENEGRKLSQQESNVAREGSFYKNEHRLWKS